MNNQAFSKIWIVVILCALLAGGILTWQYFRVPEEKAPEEIAKVATTEWKEYILEEITKDFESPDFMDRRLIGVRDDGQRDIIVPSIKELMGWEKLSGEAGFYPVKVSFPPYSSKIFFVKYLAGTGHSDGFFMLNIKTLDFKELTEIGRIYENYLNYKSIVSPDGLRVASYGNEVLYLLDPIQDQAILLAKARSGETFYLAAETPALQWIDDYTIQYPVHSASDIYAPPIEIRQIPINQSEEATKDPTANWETYNGTGYTIQYPQDWEVRTEEIINLTYLAPEEKRVPEDIWVYASVSGREDLQAQPFYNPINFFGKPAPAPEEVKIDEREFYKSEEEFEAIRDIRYAIANEDGSKIGWITLSIRYGRQRMDYYLPDSKIAPELKIFNLILSTFKFIEVDETADWKTYRNEKYGYQVRYPSEWSLIEAEKSAVHLSKSGERYYWGDIYVEERNNQNVEQWLSSLATKSGGLDCYDRKIKDIKIERDKSTMNGIISINACTIGWYDTEYTAIFPWGDNMILFHCVSLEDLTKMLFTFRFLSPVRNF